MMKTKLTAPTLIKTGGGFVASMKINSGTPGTNILLWDNTAPSGKLVLSYTVTVNTKQEIRFDFQFIDGLFVEIRGDAEVDVYTY